MDAKTDLNMILANHERTFALKARQYRAKAAAAAERMGLPENARVADAMAPERERDLEQAERWEARRREAALGYFLARPVDLNDPDYISEYGELFAACQEAGRVVYEASPGDEQLQQQSRTTGS